jgi:hypothetical protein
MRYERAQARPIAEGRALWMPQPAAAGEDTLNL